MIILSSEIMSLCGQIMEHLQDYQLSSKLPILTTNIICYGVGLDSYPCNDQSVAMIHEILCHLY